MVSFYVGQILLLLLGILIGAAFVYFGGALLQHRRQRKSGVFQAGNMMLLLFGAIAIAGVLGTGFVNTIKGPGRALDTASRTSSIENNVLAATKLVVSGDATKQDCDGDGTVEPMAFRSGTGPTGGGLIPLDSGASKNDPWGRPLGYCVWDHGKKSVSDNVTTCGGSSANRLQGGNVTTENVLAVVSAGKDGIFQTTCNAWVDANTNNMADIPLIVTTPGSDDIVKRDTIESLMSSGALAQLPTLPDAACIVGAEGTMRYENGVPQVCTSTGWKEIGGATNSASSFTATTGVNPSSVQTSNAITMSGFFGTRTATVDNGGSIVVNGVDMGATAEVTAGNTVAIKGTSAAGYLTLKTFILKIGAISKSWDQTTRAATAAAFSVSPATSSNMNVTGPGSPAYGSAVQFTVTNTGETNSAAINAIGFSPATNFETTGTNLCTGSTVAAGATCTFYARPKATANGALSSTLTVSATGATSGTATLSGAASGFSCTLPWGGSIADGATVTAYSVAQSADCEANSLVRTCTGGVLDGSASFDKETCTLPVGLPYCWGKNSGGSVGDGTTTERRTPVAVTLPSGTTGFSWIQAGSDSLTSCGIADTGNAYCWGDNAYSMFGNGNTTDSNTPSAVTMPSGVKFVTISVGSRHVCALGDNGRAYCWGDNSNTQIGDGTTTSRTTPVLVTLPSGVTSFKSVNAAKHSSCGIGNNDQAYCWGDNAYGQLGDGTTSDRSTPKIVTLTSGVTSWKSVVTGPYSASCGIGNNDRAYCWGTNTQGQIGDNSTSQRNSPTAVTLPGGVTGFKSVTPGTQAACGVANTGAFYCWGNGNNCRRPGTCSGSVSTPTATSGYPSGAIEWKQIGLGGDRMCHRKK